MREIAHERSPEQISEHYEIEKQLASRLRMANKAERRHLYHEVYTELLRRVPDHPCLTRQVSPEALARMVHAQMQLLKRFLGPQVSFMELGPGDCALSAAVAQHVRKVYAIDVSNQMAGTLIIPDNLTLVVFDGCTIPLSSNSIRVAYSYQVMEHLHPDDAVDQIQEIFRVLEPGGVYLCVTPNRLSGPWDISSNFDAIATGFHLREYTTGELERLFKRVGFSKINSCIGVKGRFVVTTTVAPRCCEWMIARLPSTLCKRLARAFPLRSVLDIRLLATK